MILALYPVPPLRSIFQAQCTEGCNYLQCLSKMSPTPKGLLSVLLKSQTDGLFPFSPSVQLCSSSTSLQLASTLPRTVFGGGGVPLGACHP